MTSKTKDAVLLQIADVVAPAADTAIGALFKLYPLEEPWRLN